MKTTISLILVAMYFLPVQTEAKTIKYNYCDKVFSDSFFQEVSPELEKLCRNRFIFLTNQIKRTLPQYNK